MQQWKIIQASNFVLSIFLIQNEDKNFPDKNKKYQHSE
jgi:hypothetical protein